jgi:hypothetical protein
MFLPAKCGKNQVFATVLEKKIGFCRQKPNPGSSNQVSLPEHHPMNQTFFLHGLTDIFFF